MGFARDVASFLSLGAINKAKKKTKNALAGAVSPNSAGLDFHNKQAGIATKALESSAANAAAHVGRVRRQGATSLAGHDAATTGGLQERRFEAARAVAAAQGRGSRVGAGAASDTALAQGAGSAAFLGQQQQIRSQLEMAQQNNLYSAQQDASGQSLASAEGMLEIGTHDTRRQRAQSQARALYQKFESEKPMFGGDDYVNAKMSGVIASSDDPYLTYELQAMQGGY